MIVNKMKSVLLKKIKDLVSKLKPPSSELVHYKIEIDFINTFSREGRDYAGQLDDMLLNMDIPTHFYDWRESYFYVSLVKRKDVKRLKEKGPRKAVGSIEDVYKAVKKAGYNPRKPVIVK